MITTCRDIHFQEQKEDQLKVQKYTKKHILYCFFSISMNFDKDIWNGNFRRAITSFISPLIKLIPAEMKVFSPQNILWELETNCLIKVSQ